jgi:hypothetical protein
MTAAEMHEVQEAERVTEERKAKRGVKAPQKWGPKARKASLDESEVESEASEQEAMELYDCIEVET